MARRFAVDSMLGKLAKWLRILGFDTRCERIASRAELDEFKSDGCIVVTRNRRWSIGGQVVLIEANEPAEQLRELVAAVGIAGEELQPLSRCIRCNDPLRIIARREAVGAVPDHVYETQAEFYQCPGCGRTYWPGSHSKHMSERLAWLWAGTRNRSAIPAHVLKHSLTPTKD